MFSRLLRQASIVALASILAPAALAQEATYNFDIPSQSMSDALRAYAQMTGEQLIFSDAQIGARQSAPIAGQLTSAAALARLLDGTGLTHTRRASGVVVIQDPASPTQLGAHGQTASSDAAGEELIVVTGTRIRGAPPASPVITLDADTMRAQGHNNLGDVARAVPQSFGGGSNPGVALGAPDRDNSNLSGGSSLNLRGLGADATLTLLNGQRLPYSTHLQAIDISSIPMGAVDRLEIMADGASAIYGSDAVGGVANIILRRDYDGVRAEASHGATSDGGGEQRQFNIVAGQTWSSGAIMAAFDWRQVDPILAGDRDYTDALLDGVYLTPEQEMSLALVTLQQEFGARVTFEADTLYGARTRDMIQALATSGLVTDNGTFQTTETESFSLSPRLRFDLGGDWQASLALTYGFDNVDFSSDAYTAGALSGNYPGHYRNDVAGGEISAEGPLAQLPGGAMRLAIGAGQRENSLDGYLAFNYVGGASIVSTDFDASRGNTYAYAELFTPLIGRSQDIAWARELSLSAAVRYEDYEDAGDIVTPKLALLYAPTETIDLSVSWGQSFKAPTLYQSYRGLSAYLFPHIWFDPSAAPTDTVLRLDGSNSDLEPEKADTWTAAISLRPHWLPDGEIEITYFHIAYEGRVIQPLYSWDGSLTNPLTANFIIVAPSSGDISDAVNGNLGLIQNYTGAPLDPANVVAIVDGREHNANEQSVEGVDVSARTAFDLPLGSLTLQSSLAYLRSEQQLESGGQVEQLAGRAYRQPHWRGRVTAGWEVGDTSLAATLNYTGGSRNFRFTPVDEVAWMTTLDLTARHRLELPAMGARGVELGLVVLNAFNEAPDTIRTTSPYDAPYDSTNFSVTGRYVGVSIGVDW